MTLKDILKKQMNQRYKSLIFLVSLENSDFEAVKEVFEKEEYELVDIYTEIQEKKFSFQKFIDKKLEYLKDYFNRKNSSSKMIIVTNIEILMSMLDEGELKNFMNQLSFDNYVDANKNQTIFLFPDIIKYRKIEMQNEDDKSSRVYKIENIEI